MNRTKQKGFSLVELMIVVAIIGVLTAIAIPNFQAFQARSRMSEARSGLASIYTAAQAFHSEWEVYTGALKPLGWEPTGDFRYVIGFHSDLHEACGEDGDDLVDAAKLNCGPAPQRIYNGNADDKTHTGDIEGADYLGNAALYGTTHWKKGATALAAGVVYTDLNVNDFMAGAVGDPAGLSPATPVAADLDAWQIDENKDLSNIQGADLEAYL